MNTDTPAVTPWTYVRAAMIANRGVAGFIAGLIVAVLVDGERPMTREELKGFAFSYLLGTAVDWVTAALLAAWALLPGQLRARGRRLTTLPRSSPSGGAEMWDSWLDGPFRL